MIPAAYSTLEVRGTASTGHGTMIVPIMARLMPVLHSIFTKHPDCYALDFPEMKPGKNSKPPLLGKAVRVFSVDRDRCEMLLDVIEQHDILSQALICHRIRTIPTDYSGPVAIVRRKRIAPRSQPDNRRADLEEERDNRSPFLPIHSKSTGQNFTLLLQRKVFLDQSMVPNLEQGVPNSYGLSGKRPVFLPDLPL